MQGELDQARQAANEAAGKLGNGGNDETILKELIITKERIVQVHKRIAGLTKVPLACGNKTFYQSLMKRSLR